MFTHDHDVPLETPPAQIHKGIIGVIDLIARNLDICLSDVGQIIAEEIFLGLGESSKIF